MTAYDEEMKRRAIEAFKNHEIIYQHVAQDHGENVVRPECVRIARPYPLETAETGVATEPQTVRRYDSTYATELIALWGNKLYVGGDIAPVVFAYHDNNSLLGMLRWIGGHDDIAYYVHQKAGIGLSDGGQLTNAYDARVAEERLRWELQQLEKDEAQGVELSPRQLQLREGIHQFLDLEVSAGGAGSAGSGYTATDSIGVYDVLRGYINDPDGDFCDIGQVCAPRVYFAWGAAKRALELLTRSAVLNT